MTGGAGFSRDGEARLKANRSLLRNELPFQRLKENPIRRKKNFKVKPSTIADLHRIKAQKQKAEKRRKQLFVILRFLIVLTIILMFWLVR